MTFSERNWISTTKWIFTFWGGIIHQSKGQIQGHFYKILSKVRNEPIHHKIQWHIFLKVRSSDVLNIFTNFTLKGEVRDLFVILFSTHIKDWLSTSQNWICHFPFSLCILTQNTIDRIAACNLYLYAYLMDKLQFMS